METQSKKHKKVILNFLNAVWVDRDLDLALSYVDDDVQYIGVRNEFQGKVHYKEMVAGYLSVFEKVTIDYEDWVSENNKIFMKATFSGIHSGTFEGIPPTHKRISFKLFNLFEISNGKIKSDWDILDELGLMQQLGMELVHKELAH